MKKKNILNFYSIIGFEENKHGTLAQGISGDHKRHIKVVILPLVMHGWGGGGGGGLRLPIRAYIAGDARIHLQATIKKHPGSTWPGKRVHWESDPIPGQKWPRICSTFCRLDNIWLRSDWPISGSYSAASWPSPGSSLTRNWISPQWTLNPGQVWSRCLKRAGGGGGRTPTHYFFFRLQTFPPKLS